MILKAIPLHFHILATRASYHATANGADEQGWVMILVFTWARQAPS